MALVTSGDAAEVEGIFGNPAIEKAAIDWVIEQERMQGRAATDARGSGLGGAGDIESDGRIIEVKAFSKWGLKSTGLLLFTPAQLREGERNANYYVYIVENVAQGDPSKFELRVLHGEDLQRLFAGAKPQRFYVPLRAADYARLTRLGGVEPEPPRVHSENGGGLTSVSPGTKGPVMPARRAMPILDTKTGKEYRSKAAAGKALAPEVGGDIGNNFVWYQVLREFPDRFLTKNPDGRWVALNDPSVPPGSTMPGS